jgi:hypothetical protein
MEKRLPKLTVATMLALLVLSFLVAAPARAAVNLQAVPPGAGEIIAPPYAVASEPVWATLNAVPQGNYPGGNEIFDVFVVNSDHPPDGNVTLVNETLTAPALPSTFQTNNAIGLPVQLSPGQAIVNTIALEIPSDFSQNNFTANLAAFVQLNNGTSYINLKLTGSLVVYLLGLPGSGSQTTTTSASPSTQTTTQGGTVSTSLFAAGVAIPSIVVIILLALLVRGRGGPKPAL